MPGEDTAEYQIVLNCGDEIKTAIKNNLVDIVDRAVSKVLITPDNGGQLKNKYHPEFDRASKFWDLLLSKVKDHERNYGVFVNDVLGGNRRFYCDIIDRLKSEYDKIKGDAPNESGEFIVIVL
jgi:hypothetical protein